MTPPLLHFSGLQEETGRYALPPVALRRAFSLLGGATPAPEEVEAIRKWKDRGVVDLGLEGYRNLAQTGWGVVFTQKDNEEVGKIRGALKPLLDLRRQQATASGMRHRYREYRGKRGYCAGDSKTSFLEDRNTTTGEVNPDEMPYYLLIVGDPRDIPYEFQCMLDVERAVGRLWFDTIEEYARYARRVVAAEGAQAARERRAVFFAPRHAGDEATNLCVDHLVKPVAARVSRKCAGWKVRRYLGNRATKKRLESLLSGPEAPDFLFTAGHGMMFGSENPRQLRNQGALVCSEWPGPSWEETIAPDFYFSSQDLKRAAGPLIAFFFACFSGGVPARTSYDLNGGHATAPHPFVAELPRALLGGFEEGALAVIGHVDLAYIDSFHLTERRKKPLKRLVEFKQAVEQILQGYPVGAAMEIFGRRYAALATVLTEELLAVHRGKEPDDETKLWLCRCQDARNYIILGDPAVRLAPIEPLPEPRP